MGHRIALKLRSKLQAVFFKLGCFCQRHSWAVLAIGFFILIGLSVGIITAKIETDVEKLWMEGNLCKLFINGRSCSKAYESHSFYLQQFRNSRIKIYVCRRIELKFKIKAPSVSSIVDFLFKRPFVIENYKLIYCSCPYTYFYVNVFTINIY